MESITAQPGFGTRLRAARRQHDLSQADVAGTVVSASYVSLLESGRRTPTPQVADRLLTRLGMTSADFTALPVGSEAGRTGLVERLLLARAAADEGQHAVAAERLRSIIDDAADADEHVVWEALWDLAENLGAADRLAERVEATRALAAHPHTAASPGVDTLVHARLSEAHRDCGQLQQAIAAAEQAVTAGEALPAGSAERVRAFIAAISAYAENGELGMAEGLARRLSDEIENVHSPRVRASAHWAVGNVWFMTGRSDDAVAEHDQAFTYFQPAMDVRQWARLCKAAAMMRMKYTEDIGGVEDLLRRSRQGLELAGHPADMAELAAAEARHRLLTGDPRRALELVDESLRDEEAMSTHELAEAHLTAARAHAALGQLEDAAKVYRRCADQLESAGQLSRTIAVLRELVDLHDSSGGAGSRSGRSRRSV